MNGQGSGRANDLELPLDGMRVVVLVAEGVEDLEYWVTVMRLREAGAVVTSVGTTTEPVAGKHGLEARAERLVDQIDASTVDAWSSPAVGPPTSSAVSMLCSTSFTRFTRLTSRSGSSATAAWSRSRPGSSYRVSRRPVPWASGTT